MVDIVFNTGIADGEAVIAGNIVYGSDFSDYKNGITDYITGDSQILVYDHSAPNIVRGELVIKNVTYSDYIILDTWIRDKALFMITAFSITCIPSTFIDLGKGRGTALTGVHYNKKDTEGVFKVTPPGIYEIKFPYIFIR